MQALSDVTFAIRRGEIYGLIGPNGAGKTTLFNVLTGIYAPDGGDVRVRRRAACATLKPNDVAERGIARTFQNIRLFANLSALENVMIGRHVRTHAGVFGAILRNRAHARRGAGDREARATSCSTTSASRKRANDLAKHLAYGDQRRLEIARALATEPKLLALDEPAAGMNATENATLRKLLERIRRDGTTILLIEHDMKLVMSVCDRVLVLDYGKQDRRRARRRDVQKDPKVIEAYLGDGRASADRPAVSLLELEKPGGRLRRHPRREGHRPRRWSQGELVCLIGANGAGKTTTLKGDLRAAAASRRAHPSTTAPTSPALTRSRDRRARASRWCPRAAASSRAHHRGEPRHGRLRAQRSRRASRRTSSACSRSSRASRSAGADRRHAVGRRAADARDRRAR